MSEWQETLFADLLIESKDGEWGSGESAVGLEEVEVIRGTDFSNIDSPELVLSKRWIKSEIVKRKRLYADDILIETAGGTANQSTGRTALLKQSFFKEHSQYPVLCASFSRFLRLKTNRYNPQFIYYLLQALYKAGYMGVYNIQHTGVSRFQYTTFKEKTIIKIPPLPIQKKIAAILSAYDDLIEKNNRRIAILEKMAEEIYREWFVRLRFPGHEQVKFHKGIPEGWEISKIGDICKIKGGKRLPKGHSLIDSTTSHQYIKGQDIKNGRINTANLQYLDNKTFEKIKNYTVKQNDICITIVANIGNVGIVPATLDGANLTENAVKLTNFKDGIYPQFIKFSLSTKFYKEYMETLAAGAAQSKLGIYKIQTITLLLPPTKLQQYFNEIVVPISDNTEYLRETNQILIKTRDRLLTRLISGKLSVKDLDIQFPPSMTEELE